MIAAIVTWNVNPVDVGPIYPFVGMETRMFAACAAFVALFLVWKFSTETAGYTERAKRLRESGGLNKALNPDKDSDNE